MTTIASAIASASVSSLLFCSYMVGVATIKTQILSPSLFLSSILFSWLCLFHRSSSVSSVNRTRGELSGEPVPPGGFRRDSGILVLALRRQHRHTWSQYSGGCVKQNSSSQNTDQKTRGTNSNRRRFTVLKKYKGAKETVFLF